ncbi:MAG: recombinase family protein [Deltaproteobacteria bacterium]|nr:recombinase family protein [Deltaproteobacteria bacterium]
MLDNAKVTAGKGKILRCAVYTRKSHEEGLEQEFNSLDAQRESAEAYIESQKLQGWRLLPDRYDDGGFSGGTMDRPALQRLLTDIDAGKVDLIVVYKIDRLSRSLLDFMKMIELFNEKGVSFVSVTQHFSTTDPTGRMFLGILITFAQYEREVIAERIRDKVAAAKRRGKYCGGVPILGYDVDRESKKLLVNPEEARLVQYVFRRFIQVGSAKKLAQELNDQGYRTKAWTTKKGKVREGAEWNTGHVYRLLNNRVYIGEIIHKEASYPGEHEGIVDRPVWDKVQAILADNKPVKISMARTKMVAPLKGVIHCGHCGCSMGPTYTRKKDRNYTYYICEKDAKRAVSLCPLKRVPAGDIEKAVLEQMGAVFRTPTLVAKTYFAAREIEGAEKERLSRKKAQLEEELAKVRRQAMDLMKPGNDIAGKGDHLTAINSRAVDLSRQLTLVASRCSAYDGRPITEQDVSEAFQNVEAFWEDLFPVERNRLIRLLVKKVEIRETGIDMELATGGLTALITELAGLACEVNERRAVK